MVHNLLRGKSMENVSQKNLAQQTISQMRNASRAILFLRIFIGGVMLLHVVGKLQTYSNLVIDFPEFLGFSSATTLSITILFQALAAALIVIGVATRFVAAIMFLITLMSIAASMQLGDMTIVNLKLEFLYLGIYTTLVISGSGIYGFNVPWTMKHGNTV